MNHGYPPLYNAGSEIDTQNTALALRSIPWISNVSVFSREANVFAPDYELRTTTDQLDKAIQVTLVNHPREAPYMQYSNSHIDDAFRTVMRHQRPRVVHFGHVNHLSSGLPRIAKQEFGAAVVFTLHDFFHMCPRGQFLVVGPAPKGSGLPVYELCNRQVNEKCATRCFARRFGSGAGTSDLGASSAQAAFEISYWSSFVDGRMKAFRDLQSHVDMFTAPSKQLLNRFVDEFGLPAQKISFLPYGFHLDRLAGRKRASSASDKFTFGYIGRHQPSKGINLLVDAAFRIVGRSPGSLGRFRVVIYGREDGENTSSIRRQILQLIDRSSAAVDATMKNELANLVQFRPEYANSKIVEAVFNHVDAIVVPSIWNENSPLVIHEAQHARVPVITADAGGMAELVRDDRNGFLFKHRDAESLSHAMEKALSNPERMRALGQVGYLFDESGRGDAPDIHQQTQKLARIYASLLA